MIRQFVYVYRVAEISLLSGKNTKYWPKPSLHGLSLSKSLIKNHATLFGLGQVVKLDQTKLDSTKPALSIYLVRQLISTKKVLYSLYL